MSEKSIPCIYCQTDNDVANTKCTNCGMAMPTDHPLAARNKTKFFRKAFWGIVIFCVVMMIYLPRYLFG